MGEDGADERLDDFAALWIRRGGADDDRLAEEEIDHGLDAPGDIVLDDDFLAGDAVEVFGEENVGAAAQAGDACGQAPFLGLAVGALGSGLAGIAGRQGFHRIAVVGPEPAESLGVAAEEPVEGVSERVV